MQAESIATGKAQKTTGIVRFTGTMSVSQKFPGSGDETNAKGGRWILFLKSPREESDGLVVERVKKVTLLDQVKEILQEKSQSSRLTKVSR